MHLRLTTALASAVVAVGLGLTAGCSSADDTAACNKILEEIQSVGTDASGLTSDPAALGEVYTNAAANIRTASGDASDDVKTAASSLADELDKLGSSMINLDSSNPQIPNTTAFVAAGNDMQEACN